MVHPDIHFEDWLESLDMTLIDSAKQIEVFLRLAWDEGYACGYENGYEESRG